ncbi:hypothetical protein [Accumulibacter sp.]|uniref:hypothetical protein n=1 Tax=Accumulibacter sp. TaxID=2053492 RepID=UPI0025881D66|nr:hypothetical protein [Accumulibacter sp.]
MLAGEMLTLVRSNADEDRILEEPVQMPLSIGVPARVLSLSVVQDFVVTPSARSSRHSAVIEPNAM